MGCSPRFRVRGLYSIHFSSLIIFSPFGLRFSKIFQEPEGKTMKICRECNVLYQQQVMSCQECKKDVEEISFGQVLELTQKVAFRKHIGGEDAHELTDPYKQYHIRSYLKDRSLFLEFDLYKNRLKHGNQLKRFFIAPI